MGQRRGGPIPTGMTATDSAVSMSGQCSIAVFVVARHQPAIDGVRRVIALLRACEAGSWLELPCRM